MDSIRASDVSTLQATPSNTVIAAASSTSQITSSSSKKKKSKKNTSPGVRTTNCQGGGYKGQDKGVAYYRGTANGLITMVTKG